MQFCLCKKVHRQKYNCIGESFCRHKLVRRHSVSVDMSGNRIADTKHSPSVKVIGFADATLHCQSVSKIVPRRRKSVVNEILTYFCRQEIASAYIVFILLNFHLKKQLSLNVFTLLGLPTYFVLAKVFFFFGL